MLTGYRTVIGMGLALGVALWQFYVGPIPDVDPQVWAIVVPIVGLILRYVTKGPIGGAK